MRYVAGYDRDFSRQFFLRTFQSLAPCGRFSEAKFLPEEFAYVATRFSETAVFSRGERLGSPWEKDNPKRLVWTTRNPASQSLFQKAERAANQLLIREGIVRKNIENLTRNFEHKLSQKQEIIEALYWNASTWQHLGEPDRFVLRRMSLNVSPWMRLLALIPENDYLEILASRPSPLLIS